MNNINSYTKLNNLMEGAKLPVQRESVKIEYLKHSGYGKTYAIIKEQNLYVVKESEKPSNFAKSDLKNIETTSKTRFHKQTLQEAIKVLNMYINETKYVLNVPNPQPAQPTQNEVQPSDVSGEFNDIEDDDNMEQQLPDENNEGDGEDIQQLTGKLTAEIRKMIDAGREEPTVGAFKSVLSSAKGLSDENKDELMGKAKSVLATDDVENNNDTNDTNNENPPENQDNNGDMFDEDVDWLNERNETKKLLFDMQKNNKIKGYKMLDENDGYSFLVQTEEGRYCVKCNKDNNGKKMSLWETENNMPKNELKSTNLPSNAAFYSHINNIITNK